MRKTVSYLRELPPDSLPRERLVNFGAKALSNQELLAKPKKKNGTHVRQKRR